MLLLVTASLSCGQEAAGGQWRALYVAEVGEPVTLDLTLFTDGTASGHLTLPNAGSELAGSGTFDQGSNTLELQFPSPQASAPPLIELRGELSSSWQEGGATITAELTVGEGPSSAAGSGRLIRVAQWAFADLTQGRIEVGYAVPQFGPAWGDLDRLLEDSAKRTQASWVREGRAAVAGNQLGWGWTHYETVDVAGLAGEYVSLLKSYSYYTGGAHPNRHTESLLVTRTDGAAEALPLESLFHEDSGWLAYAASAVLADLEQQGASGVTNGDIVELTADDLATFTLSAAGLTFHFDPYEVASYAEGSYEVTLPFAELLDYTEGGGALEAFANLRR